MKPRQLEDAQGRLLLCHRAYQALTESFTRLKTDPRSQRDCDIHWLDFLVQWKGAYSKIQQAAKDTPQEIQWFGVVNNERRGDPLLRWLFEARNDGEHGLEHSIDHSPMSYGLRGKTGGEIVISGIRPGPDGHPQFLGPDGKLAPIDVIVNQRDDAMLKEVTERDGARKVPPPTSHLGEPMIAKPLVAAELGIRWLEGLVAIAKAMGTP